jgi:hypothetical protein
MNLSKRVVNMIEELEQEDVEESNDQRLVEFLESVGIQEGIDFCYDDEILISDEIDTESLASELNTSKFPTVKFEKMGEDVVARYITGDQIVKSVVLPLPVYQLLLYRAGV